MSAVVSPLSVGRGAVLAECAELGAGSSKMLLKLTRCVLRPDGYISPL